MSKVTPVDSKIVQSEDGNEQEVVVMMTMSQLRLRSVNNESNHKKEEDQFTVKIRRDSIALVNNNTGHQKSDGNVEEQEEYDLAHNFVEHNYGSPTNCEVCSGLLVGLWSQGLQCTACGLNVHRGGGINDHDDCRAEAMFTPCMGATRDGSTGTNKEDKSLSEAMHELATIAKDQPNFFGEIRAQMDRDVMNRVADTIVAKGVEGEKSKKFLRAKQNIILPLLEYIDSIQDMENGGAQFHAVLCIIRIHAVIDIIAAMIGFILFTLAIIMRHGDQFTYRTFHLALIHEATVLVTVHVTILLLALFLRYLSKIFKRKVILIDQFLHEKFVVDAYEDFGVSVAGAARRAVWWSNQITVSAAITCYASMTFWWISQPSLELLKNYSSHNDNNQTSQQQPTTCSSETHLWMEGGHGLFC